jgi:hypothetical protein
MIEWEPSDYIEFSARRGDEQLHVRVIGGMDHPSDDPQLLAVVLEVRLGPRPDRTQSPDPGGA